MNKQLVLKILFALLLFQKAYSRQLHEGISYSNIYLSDHVYAHILEVDPDLFDIVAAKAEDNQLESVLTFVRQYNAIAGINGGFFLGEGAFADLPMGVLKINHDWIATPHKSRGAIGWSNNDQKVLYDQILTSVKGCLDGQDIQIDGINRIRKDDQIILYNHRFYETTCTNGAGIELVIQDQRVIEIGEKGMSIPNDGIVLSIGPSKELSLLNIQEGAPFSWDIQVVPQSNPTYTISAEWSRVTHIVGGTPILIRGGEMVTDFSLEQTLDRFLNHSYARTAVGLLPNGHWIFVVVDGQHRLFFNDLGITIPTLARLMFQLGCVEALNLCGGKSSTMILNERVMNTAEGDEDDGMGHRLKRVSDALLVIPK